jgi:phosphoribosylformylglycinamidine synthase
MERRAQEVINACWQLGANNPIISIHDVGAGGLSNAFPEITNDAKRGAIFDLRKIPLEESAWRRRKSGATIAGTLRAGIAPESLELFKAMCERERCLFAVVGVATEERQLKLIDPELGNEPVDMPMDVCWASRRRCSATCPRGTTSRHRPDRHGPGRSRAKCCC